MWDNDSTYCGEADRTDFFFRSPISPLTGEEDEFSRTWVSMSDELKSKFADCIKMLNELHGLDLPRPDDLTSYDNPDYLWLSYEMENIRQAYNEAMINPVTGDLLPGHGRIPYVQVRLKSLAYSNSSCYPKATLNQYGSEIRPHYVVEFDYYFLKAFMCFLAEVFDDNPQTYYDDASGRRIVTHQYRAPIYRMPAFDKYFSIRHDIPGLIFHKAVQFLLAHELAHIGCGHLDLQAVDPEYGNDIDTKITEEDKADARAICWVLGIRFLEMNHTVLDISYEDFIQEMSLSVLAVYILYTWNYSKDERVWTKETVVNYGHKDHLPYQLRAFNMLSVAMNRLNHLGEWSERDGVTASDGKQIGQKTMKQIQKNIFEMIQAFETAYHMFFAKTEDVYNLMLNQKFDKIKQMIMNEEEPIPQIAKENIPWLLGFELEAQEELKRVHELWKEVRERLVANGTYCKLSEYEPWVDLPNPN